MTLRPALARRGLGRRRLTSAWLGALVLLASLVPRPVGAHVVDVVSLVLTELAPGTFRVAWQTTSTALAEELADPATFPSSCRVSSDLLTCAAPGLVGTLSFPWLVGTRLRLIVDITWREGQHLSRVLTATSPRLAVYGPGAGGWATWAPLARDHLRLGLEHILTGFDHLLFVLGLVLLVESRRALIATITAFTVAHSVSLAATTFRWIDVPTAPVEATIALSIVLVASEALQTRRSLTRRAPWAVAFVFGLVHGLGFASALLAIGLPEDHVPGALLFFNVGVELGQLAAVAVFLLVAWLVRRAPLRGPALRTATIYAMGSLAAFWSLERIAALFGAG